MFRIGIRIGLGIQVRIQVLCLKIWKLLLEPERLFYGFKKKYKAILDQNIFQFCHKNHCPGSGLDVDSAKPASGSGFSDSRSADGQNCAITVTTALPWYSWLVCIWPGIGRRPDGHPTVPPSLKMMLGSRLSVVPYFSTPIHIESTVE